MSEGGGTTSKQWPWRLARLAVVLVPIYLYVWLAVDPSLVYGRQCPVVRASMPFLVEHLSRPGGLGRYVGGFLSQLYVWPWAGALVVAGAILSVCLLGGAVLRAVCGRRAGGIALLAAAPLVSLHSLYHYPLYVSVDVAVALAAAAVYVRLPVRSAVVRLGLFVLLSVGLFHAVGAGVLLFGLLCGLYELLAARRWLLGAAALLLAGPLPYVASQWFVLMSTSEAYRVGLSFPYEPGLPIASAALYLLFPVAAVCLWLPGPVAALAAARRRRRPPNEGEGDSASEPEHGPPPRWRRWLLACQRTPHAVRFLAGALAILGVCSAAAWRSFDARSRDELRIDKLARREDWAGVLRAARRMPLAHVTVRVACNVDRALYHAGRLPYEMFAFPHKMGMPGLMLYVGTRWVPDDPLTCALTSDLLFELGHVNESEHLANEAIEFAGERPYLLKRLSLVYVLKGQPVAARTFLGALAQQPLHAREAGELRQLLDADPTLASLGPVRDTRSRMPRLDGGPWPSAEQLLLLLLDSNPRNRMAFEYLMAHYLLTRQLDKFARAVVGLRVFGETELPRHYEEALLLYAYELRARGIARPIPLGGLRLRPGAQQRLERFLKARARFGQDRAAAQRGLAGDYQGTYYYYYTFGQTPGGRP